MKILSLNLILVLLSISTNTFASVTVNGKNVKAIICQSVARYDETTPDQKTQWQGFKIFKPGTRSDVAVRPDAFLLANYDLDEKGTLQEQDNLQYYLSNDANGNIHFEFIADWKSSGELTVNQDNTLKGFNTKGEITDLSCVIK